LPATIAPAMPDPSDIVIALRGETMGTIWHAQFAAPRDCDAAAIQRAIHRAIVSRLAGIVAAMSHWAPTSLLSRFNRAAAGTWTTLPADFARVMVRALAIAKTTGGAFDPAIGRLVDAWGFGSIPIDGLPSEPQIEAAMTRSGWRHLALSTSTTSISTTSTSTTSTSTTSTSTTSRSATGTHLLQPGGIALDLSGIAKGYAVDAVAALLEAAGFVHHLVEIGGELVGAGMRPDGDPWWVDLETPTGTILPPLRVALHGMAVATSGDYRRGAHTLDPRTGRAIDTGIVSASVIHRTAMDADAWATALTVLGPIAGLELAREHGLAARLVTLVDGDACEYLSPCLAAMLSD